MAELMWERGYSATSPRAVRELSGVGQGSMYHYFPTKRDLGLAALDHNCRVQLDSWKAALKGLEDPLEILSAYLTDLSAGATDAQLRLHLDTALSACTQALSLVGPLLPEI